MTWREDEIKEGFEDFFKKHGRYPTAQEIDKYPSLPASRSIQRRFGGLKKLRQKLGLSITNFSAGPTRSAKAQFIGERGFKLERQVEDLLVSHFGEVFVHEQKHIDNSRDRLDFFVYAKNKQFAVDVFYPSDRYSLIGCINQKQRTYNKSKVDIILLSVNQDILQQELDDLIVNKKNPLQNHFHIFSLNKFKEYIRNISPLNIC